jgi:hypothetical protein
MLKYLRIAVTALSLTACVLLVALWVRSYYYKDVLSGLIWSHDIAFESADGRVGFRSYYLNPAFTQQAWGITSYNRKTKEFAVRFTPDIVVNDWCLLLLFIAVAAIPWVNHIKWDATPRRFGLRDLFIATTLVAVGLGIIVAAR